MFVSCKGYSLVMLMYWFILNRIMIRVFEM